MTAQEKRSIIEKRGIGYFSGFAGLEIKEIVYGIEDTVFFVVGAWTGKPEAHRAVIRYTAAGAYFKYRGSRVRFDEIVRM